MVRSLAEKILLKQGYRMLTAIDTGDALRICQEHDGMIDLLLTDVVMPKMNGKELFNQLKTIRPSINVLYMSGYTENVIAQHGVLDEGTQFIAKPFTVGSLIEKVREILDSPNGR